MIHPIRRASASLSARFEGLRRKLAQRVPAMVGRPEAFAFKREFQRTFLLGRGLAPDSSLLDFGCGVLRGGVPLIEYLNPGNYCGLDVRKDAIRMARREVRRNGLKAKKPVLVHASDLRTLSLGRRFDYAWAFSVLFHLSDAHLKECLQFVARHLKTTGTFFANANLGEHTDGKWLEFPVVWRELDVYAAEARTAGLHVTALGPLSAFGHHSATDPEEDEQIMLAFAPMA